MKNTHTALHDLTDTNEQIGYEESNEVNEKVDYLLREVNSKTLNILDASQEALEIPQEALEMSLLSQVSKILKFDKEEESRIEKAIRKSYISERKRPNALFFMTGVNPLSKELAA